ncbi:MAG: hypothetical protein R8M45_10740 [Ghiorsea sp.]
MAHDTLVSIFPDWVKVIVMVLIATFSSAIITLSKSKRTGTFNAGIWMTNIGMAIVISFLVDSLAGAVSPSMNIKAEMALMVLTGILSKDLLEIAERRGLAFFKEKAGDNSFNNTIERRTMDPEYPTYDKEDRRS